MVEGVVIGVLTALVLGVLAWIAGTFQAPRHVRQWKVEVGRAWKDYRIWATRREWEQNEEVRRIDKNAQGKWYRENPGETVKAKADAKRRIRNDRLDHQLARSRAIDDAFARLRKVDVIWMATTVPGKLGWRARLRGIWKALTGPPLSMESDVLDPVLRDLDEREQESNGE